MGKKKIIVLTGFLGAGKTTFLKKMIKYLEDTKIAVVMNEFGRVSIDGELLEDTPIILEAINRGSIFCSCLKLNFVQKLIDLADSDSEYVFVEGSGLADPSNMGEILDAVDTVKIDSYKYIGGICVVDGLNFLNDKEDIETIKYQIEHCQIAVVSKTENSKRDYKDKIFNEIKKINKDINIIFTDEVKAEEETMIFLNKEIYMDKNKKSSNTKENKPKSLCLTSEDNNINIKEFEGFINSMLPYAYRIKGFVKILDKTYEVHTVQNICEIKEYNKNLKTEIVFLSKVGPNIIRPIFDNWKEKINTEIKVR